MGLLEAPIYGNERGEHHGGACGIIRRKYCVERAVERMVGVDIRVICVLGICMTISYLPGLCGFFFITPAFSPQSSLSHVGISGDYCVECTCCVRSRE